MEMRPNLTPTLHPYYCTSNEPNAKEIYENIPPWYQYIESYIQQKTRPNENNHHTDNQGRKCSISPVKTVIFTFVVSVSPGKTALSARAVKRSATVDKPWRLQHC